MCDRNFHYCYWCCLSINLALMQVPRLPSCILLPYHLLPIPRSTTIWLNYYVTSITDAWSTGYYHPQMKFAKVMFSHRSVCLQGGLGLCLGVSVWGVSVWGVSVQGVSVWGVSVWGVSVWRVSVQGGLCLGGLCLGGLCPGVVSIIETPPYGNERAVHILLECSHV